VTDASGRASTVFTAPSPVVIQNPDGSSTVAAPPDVQIMIRPSETDFANSTPRTATIHLIPKGTVVPPNATVKADFTFNPTAPSDHQNVVFDGSPSTSVGGAIVDWQWTFSDGARKSGMVVTHDFEAAGTFSVTLRVTDTVGASNTTTKSLTVGQGATPTAAFVMSPASPVLNQQVNFNASASTAIAGRVIQSYDWDFGDGSAHQSGVTTSHAFGTAGTFTIVLVVTDDAGHIGTTTQTVTVSNGNPTAQITVSPPSSTVGQAISFIGSQSVAAPGRTIVSYSWNFGDGTTGSGPTTSHPYGTAGTYTVTLIVTDDQGKQGIATATVTIS
jgi:PKD repeat protein